MRFRIPKVRPAINIGGISVVLHFKGLAVPEGRQLYRYGCSRLSTGERQDGAAWCLNAQDFEKLVAHFNVEDAGRWSYWPLQ